MKKSFNKQKISTLLLSLFFVSMSVNGQNLQVSGGTSLSSLDWKYIYFDGTTESFYTASVVGPSFGLGVEYLEREMYSITSGVNFFQSGGQIASNEDHNNWKISEDKNTGFNIGVNTLFNFIPLNKKVQLMISFGPRLDYFIPKENTAFANSNTNERKAFQFGCNAKLGVYYKVNKLKIGVEGNYIGRINNHLHTEPYYSGFGAYLGTYAKDRYIVLSQLTLAYNLGGK